MANMNFGVNILPKANNTYTLGNSDYKWNIFTNSLNGVSLTNIITDVQIDGNSIVSNNIATLPIASASDSGIIKVGTGLFMSSGVLYVNGANSNQIKGQASIYVPITPKYQHEAVFYGLAKAAGDSTQAASANAVGTYTDGAKTAIQNMLDIPYSNATTSTHGLMSVEDKIKLNNINEIQIDETLDTPAAVQRIADGADNLPMEMTVGIEPVQDLHGYEYPWVGGAGKNIAKFSNNTSINSSGSPTSGEGRVGTGANDYILIESGKSYVVSFSNSSARAILAVWNGSGLVRRTTGITSGTVLDTSDGTYFFVCIYISNGSITVDEAKAMVEVGTVPTTPYAPYENICPISGWTCANVHRYELPDGYKQCDYVALSNGFTVENVGSFDTNNIIVDCEFRVDSMSANYAGLYTVYDAETRNATRLIHGATSAGVGALLLNNNSKAGGSTTIAISDTSAFHRIVSKHGSYSLDGITVTGTDTSAGSANRTTSIYIGNSNCVTAFKRIDIYTQSGTPMLSLIPCVNENGVAGFYEVIKKMFFTTANASNAVASSSSISVKDYYGDVYSISFPSSAGTVYGGTLKVNKDGTGTLTVNRKEFDLGSFTYEIVGTISLRFRTTTVIPDIIVPQYKTQLTGAICEWYKETTDEGVVAENGTFNIGTSIYSYAGKLIIHDNNYSDVNSFKSAVTGVKLIAKLSTPVTYTIPAPIICSLLGTNNIWSNTGNIQQLLYTKLTSGLISSEDKNKLDNIISIDPYVTLDTPTDIVKIENATAAVVKEIDIAIAPLQDLHGYDHPWVGGSGKNLYDISQAGNSICTVSGNTATLVATTSFQASASVFVPVSTGDYRVSFTGSTGASLEVKRFKSDKSTSVGDTVRVTSSATITISDSEVAYIRVLLSNGNSGAGTYTYNNVQVESGTTVTDYEPYSNICPISGWTGAEVTRIGKNLLNISSAADKTSGGVAWVNNHDGSWIGNGTASGGNSYPAGTNMYSFGVLPAGTYTMSVSDIYGTFVQEMYCRIGYGPSSTYLTMGNGNVSFTADGTTEYFGAICVENGKTVNYLTVYPQFEKGSVATSYIAPQRTFDISFPQSAGTVYGGTLTVNGDGTGSLVVDRLTHTVPTITSLTTNQAGTLKYTVINIPSGNSIASETSEPSIISERYKTYISGQQGSDTSCIYRNTESNYIIRFPLSATTDSATAEASGSKVVYKLATPQSPISLTTDQVLHLLSGYNTVYADCGDIQKLVYARETSGLLSASDKSKLDNIQEGAAVKDVQIDGTSILNNKIANIPIADATTYGVAKMASDAVVKAAIDYRSFITPSRINRAVFYGLAKAAGDSTQAASSNAIGNYTDSARIAIQKMIFGYAIGPMEEIARYTVTEDSASVNVTTDINENEFKLAHAQIVVKFGTPTTNTKDYVRANVLIKKSSTNTETRSCPTLGLISAGATTCWFIYTFYSERGLAYTLGKATSSGNAQNVQQTTYTEGNPTVIASIPYITGFNMAQYNNSSTLIPAGAEIIIYGCRYYD